MSWEGRGVKVEWDHVGGGTMPETIKINEDDLPPWDRKPAPAANTPLRYEPEYPDRVNEPTPESHRTQAIDAMDAQLEAAALAIAEALSWARSIGYHTEVTEPLEAAGELVSKGQGLIDAFEVRS